MASTAVTITETGDMNKILQQLPLMLQRGALDKALRAAGKVVAQRARELCPRATKTGTSKGWSDVYFAKRATAKPLAETIGVVVRKYDTTSVAVIGPQYPAGSLGHLVEFGHRHIAWGHDTGRRIPPKPFLRPAADETRGEQDAAILNVLRAELAKAGG
jgi:hypothetical protein